MSLAVALYGTERLTEKNISLKEEKISIALGVKGERKTRDRLIKIIANIKGKADDTKTLEEVIADELLAEGVIVLPCKVGDTVYCVWQYSDFAKEEPPFIKDARVVAWVIDEGVPKVITEDYGEMADSWHQLLAVGFTKEEAEKALAERSENE